MILIPTITNNMQVFFFQYVIQQPFNKSSVMCEIVMEFAAWNSILRVSRVRVRVGVGIRLTLSLIVILNLNPTVATFLTRIKLNSKFQAKFTDFNKSWI